MGSTHVETEKVPAELTATVSLLMSLLKYIKGEGASVKDCFQISTLQVKMI